MRKIFIGIIIIIMIKTPSLAKIVGTADDATLIGGGARPIGMGKTFTAIADDVDGQFYNPAGMASLRGPSAMTMVTNIMNDVYYNEFSGAIPLTSGTYGIGYINTGVNDIPTSGISSNYYDSLLQLSYSTVLSRFFSYCKNIYVGANLKLFNRGFSGGVNEFATGYSCDLGIKYIANKYLSLGICRQNVLPVSMGGVLHLSSGADEIMASIMKVGVAVRPVNFPDLLLAADTDLPAQAGRPQTSHLGAEWKQSEYLSLRCGLDQSVDPSSASKTSWNTSYGVSLAYQGWRLDYAYHSYYNDSSMATNYLSLSYTGAPLYALTGRTE